jgi:hypothetical protein
MKSKIISPENLITANYNGFFMTFVNKTISPLYLMCKYKLLKMKYRNGLDSRTLDYNWAAINFNRIAIVNLLLSKFHSPSYLEIGCASNSLFNSIPIINKIGVDPASGGTHRMTSDQFFRTNDRNFDVIFIDGLHTYNQVRLDFINALKFIKVGGFIAFHDMLPRNSIEQHVPIITNKAWTGDVWKLAFEIKDLKGVNFKLIAADYGIGICQVLDQDIVLNNNTNNLNKKTFSYYYDNLKSLPIIQPADAIKWISNS